MPATVASRQVRRYCSALVAVAIALLGTPLPDCRIGFQRRSGSRSGSPHDSQPHQARHRRYRREPELRSPLRHPCSAERGFDFEPSGQRHRAPRRLAGAVFRQSTAVHDRGPNQLFHLCRHEEPDPLHHPAGPNPERGAEHDARIGPGGCAGGTGGSGCEQEQVARFQGRLDYCQQVPGKGEGRRCRARVAQTALLITFDEGGGYYDSGFIQPIDFFGDGPRVPLVVVSPYSKGGHVAHTYADHVSILKFIERNWRLEPLSARQPRQSSQSDCPQRRSLSAGERPGDQRSVP